MGVILYETLTGQSPIGLFSLPSSFGMGISELWDPIVERLLQNNTQLRYQSYEDLLTDIELGLKIEFDEESSAQEKGKSSKGEKVGLTPIKRSVTPPGMVYIPQAEFFVGSSACGEDSLPQHVCRTDGFYMDRNSITNVQFQKFILETDYVTDLEQKGMGLVWSNGDWIEAPGISWINPTGNPIPDGFDKHPVVQVSHKDAVAYAEWAGRRLPTEQEWEYAASGGQKDLLYPWGSQISPMHANFSSDGTVPVMRYQANAFGLYDMAGNVWEWSASWYTAYPGNLQENSNFGEKYRVVRGGAWMYDGSHCMIAFRNANMPDVCYPTLGFRTVCDFKG